MRASHLADRKRLARANHHHLIPSCWLSYERATSLAGACRSLYLALPSRRGLHLESLQRAQIGFESLKTAAAGEQLMEALNSRMRELVSFLKLRIIGSKILSFAEPERVAAAAGAGAGAGKTATRKLDDGDIAPAVLMGAMGLNPVA